MPADVYLWTQPAFANPADIVLRTSAADSTTVLPTGHSVRRIVVDQWLPPDIYRETKQRLTLTVKRTWWVEAETKVNLAVTVDRKSYLEDPAVDLLDLL